MKWTKYTLETTTEAVDIISYMLSELGIEGIEIEDKIQITQEEKKRLFIDFLPELGEDDGKATISFYLEPSPDNEIVLQQVKDGLKDISEFTNIGNAMILVSETEDKDWINNWKEFFKPFRIDDTIVIKPTWEEYEAEADDIVIDIDPGVSFGTGAHETTRLCISSLKKHLRRGAVVLDAGSGSGILSIIAMRLGAKQTVGIDIDPLATATAKENAIVNGIIPITYEYPSLYDNDNNNCNIPEDGLSLITGNIIEDGGIREAIGISSYDIVVANILADVIIPLSKVIGINMKPDGIFISSGIINTKEEEVKEALIINGFHILETNRMGDWVSFVAEKVSGLLI